MNRDDIIRMAEDVGMTGLSLIDVGYLKNFAALVAAAEREACIKLIESYTIPVGNSAAGEMACEWTWDALKVIRNAIRARGEQ